MELPLYKNSNEWGSLWIPFQWHTNEIPHSSHIFGSSNYGIDNKSRRSVSVTTYQPESKRVRKENCSPLEILIDMLQYGSRCRHKVSWYWYEEQENWFKASQSKENRKKISSHYERQPLFSVTVLIQSHNNFNWNASLNVWGKYGV